MQILFIHNYHKRNDREETTLESQRRLLRKKGHEIREYYRYNDDIDRYSTLNKALLFPETLYSRNTYRALRGWVEYIRPDVVHIFNVFPLISPAIYHALADAHVPIVQAVQDYRFLCPNGSFFTHGHVCELCKNGNTFHSMRFRCCNNSLPLSTIYAISIGLHRRLGTFKRIDKYIAATEFSKRKLIEGGVVPHDKISVLGSFIPDPLPAVDHSSREPNTVLYIGKLAPEAGVELFVRTAKQLPEIAFLIAGEGPERTNLEEIVRNSRTNNVQFLGAVYGEDKYNLLRSVQVTVVPSIWYENLPISILESWAVGTPVIVSDIGCFPYIVSDGNDGLTFPVGDVGELKSCLMHLAANPELGYKLGKRGRYKVETEYSESAYYSKLMSVYKYLSSRSTM